MATRSAKPRAPRTITVKATKSGTAARKMRSAKPVPVVDPMSLGRAGSAVRDGIVNSLTTLPRIEGEIVVLVRSAVSGTPGAAGTVADELVIVVRDVVAGAVQATEQVGTGLIASAKGIAKGVVLGVHEVGCELSRNTEQV
jgi:hypothetical protein